MTIIAVHTGTPDNRRLICVAHRTADMTILDEFTADDLKPGQTCHECHTVLVPTTDEGTAPPDGSDPDGDSSRRTPSAAGGMPETAWQAMLEAAHSAGRDAGRNAAEWRAQDTVGGRTTGDVTATARTVLDGLDNGDPAVLDSLPDPGDPTDALQETLLTTDGTDTDSVTWDTLDVGDRQDLVDSYRDGFTTRMQDQVAALCRAAIDPSGDGCDLSHLHPDRLRIGSVGVFNGEWMPAGDSGDGPATGFVGVLLDWWNGWAVFSCTRVVAEAIVADQHSLRVRARDRLIADGVPEAELDECVDNEWSNLSFDGDTIVADERALHDDPDAIVRMEPDPDGRYVVMGWNWCWTPIDPYLCDRIVGDLPAHGEQQAFVTLTHTPQIRLPHYRLRAERPDRRHSRPLDWCHAALTLDGQPAGIAFHSTTDVIELDLTTGSLSPDDWRDYLDRCRDNGNPASGPRVLEALITERLLDDLLTQPHDDGAWLRVVDTDGCTVEVHSVTPAPHGHRALCALGDWLPRVEGAHWQIWDTRCWRAVPRLHRVTPTPAPAATDLPGKDR